MLLCSPEAAAAKWVRREVDFWLQRRSPDTLLLILTDGEIVWDAESGDFDRAKTTALPASLAGVYREEPLHLDLRAARTSVDLSLSNPDFRDKIADLSAALRGISKDEMIGEDVRQHRRTKAVAWATGTALAIATVVSAGLAWVAAESAQEARRQRDEAVAQRRNAESREFAARALLAVETDPAAALELAVQAGQRGDNPSSEAALRSALGASHAEAILRRAGGIAQAVFTPDGQRLLTADGAITVWDVGSARVVASLAPSRARPGARFAQVVVSPDGARVAARIADEVHVWDIGSPTPRLTFTTPGVIQTSYIAFSPDGSKILAVYGASVTVRSTETGNQLVNVSGPILVHAALSPDGRVLAAASNDGFSVELVAGW